jgi:hypothetical protein
MKPSPLLKHALTNLLSAGPVAVKEIEAEAKAAGHAWATMRRAKDDLRIRAYKETDRWMWSHDL